MKAKKIKSRRRVGLKEKAGSARSKSGRDGNSIVRGISERQHPQIVIAIDNVPDEYLSEQAERRGWKLVNVIFCGGKLFPWLNCQGAIVSQLPDSEFVKNLRDSGCNKIVRLGKLPHPQDDQLPAVLPDLKSYGTKAADHFHERHFKNVAYIGREPWSDMLPLYEGFSSRSAELGMKFHLLRLPDIKITPDNPPFKKALIYMSQIKDWIKDLPKPLGLLAHGDVGAAQYCFMISQSGLEVPTDVAVLGTGSHPGLCESSMPPISSFVDGRSASVHAACDLLSSLLSGEEPPRSPIMVPPGEVIERRSTNILAVSNPVVGRALRFIWDNFDRPLSVTDIARAVSVSRRNLDNLFSRHFSRSVKAELNRKRLEKCRYLLENTELNIKEVAVSAGFFSAEYLRESFRNAFALSPRHYRNKHRKKS